MGWYDANPVHLNQLPRYMKPEMIFDYMGIILDSNAAQDLNLKLNFNITDDAEYLVTVNSGVLLYQKDAQAADADVTLTLKKGQLFGLLTGNTDGVTIAGGSATLGKLREHMVSFEFFFNIVEP